MAIERTLSIIKPDATKRNLTGKINAKFEEAGLRIIAQKRIHLSKDQAGVFYEVHAERPFYDELCDFMASEPVVVQVLEGEGAILKNREVMGATNPAEAAEGTVRAEYADSVGENSVHGSDAPETAAALLISSDFIGFCWISIKMTHPGMTRFHPMVGVQRLRIINFSGGPMMLFLFAWNVSIGD